MSSIRLVYSSLTAFSRKKNQLKNPREKKGENLHEQEEEAAEKKIGKITPEESQIIMCWLIIGFYFPSLLPLFLSPPFFVSFFSFLSIFLHRVYLCFLSSHCTGNSVFRSFH